jgi:hypothetical protein
MGPSPLAEEVLLRVWGMGHAATWDEIRSEFSAVPEERLRAAVRELSEQDILHAYPAGGNT